MLTDNPAGVTFALCVIWLFLIKWMLLPRRERLPIAVQTALILCLCVIWIIMIRWYQSRPVRYPPDWWIHVLYFFIPLPIGVLGCRFAWCFFSARNEKTWLTQVCFQICIFLTMAALLSVFSTLIGSLQKVREAAIFARGGPFHFTNSSINS